jgi:hypothetical protein
VSEKEEEGVVSIEVDEEEEEVVAFPPPELR